MENKIKGRTRISDLIDMLPAFVFVLSILLLRLHRYSMPLSNVYWTEATDATTLSDLFAYWKAIAILAAAGLAVVVLVLGYLKDSFRFKRAFFYIPMLVYSALVLISLACSDYKYFALRGMQEHFEGTFVLLAYMMMVFFLFNAVDSERRLKYVVYCALGAAFLINVLGVTQATGHDFLTTAVGQKMMTPNFTLDNGMKIWDMIDILALSGQSVYSYSFTAGEVYQTVYNINYVPLYLSLLVPVSAILFIYFAVSEDKRKKGIAVIFLALFGLFVYNFFAANSASGYFGLAAIFVAALIVFRKNLKKWIKPILCLVLVIGLIMGVLADRWLPEVKGMFRSASRALIDAVYADDQPQVKRDYENAPASVWIPVDYIETHDDHINFGINGSEILVTRDDEHSSFVITDGEGEQLYMMPVEGRENEFQILDDRFHDYVKLWLEKSETYTYIVIQTHSFPWRFCYTGEEFLYQNLYQKKVALEKVPHAGVFKNYDWGTNRGRIWDTTIPMLKHSLLFGKGADTYAFAFPQNDYVTFHNMMVSNSQTTITDKAHNLYLQYWVNTGLISLLAWLAIAGYYFAGAVKSFRKRGFTEFSDYVNGGIFCGILGFLFVAFFNDGSVNTMPAFYTMLGLGLAINAKDKWGTAEKADAAHEPQMPEV